MLASKKTQVIKSQMNHSVLTYFTTAFTFLTFFSNFCSEVSKSLTLNPCDCTLTRFTFLFWLVLLNCHPKRYTLYTCKLQSIFNQLTLIPRRNLTLRFLYSDLEPYFDKVSVLLKTKKKFSAVSLPFNYLRQTIDLWRRRSCLRVLARNLWATLSRWQHWKA